MFLGGDDSGAYNANNISGGNFFHAYNDNTIKVNCYLPAMIDAANDGSNYVKP